MDEQISQAFIQMSLALEMAGLKNLQRVRLVMPRADAALVREALEREFPAAIFDTDKSSPLFRGYQPVGPNAVCMFCGITVEATDV